MAQNCDGTKNLENPISLDFAKIAQACFLYVHCLKYLRCPNNTNLNATLSVLFLTSFSEHFKQKLDRASARKWEVRVMSGLITGNYKQIFYHANMY